MQLRKNCAIKKETLVKTTWRIPENLYAEIKAVSDRDKISINAVGIERLQAAAVSARFDNIDRDIASLKKMLREVLDRLETR